MDQIAQNMHRCLGNKVVEDRGKDLLFQWMTVESNIDKLSDHEIILILVLLEGT